MTDNVYNSSKIRLLKGLEPIQLRPSMYTRTETPNHMIQEVIDNAQDEALAGHANVIEIRVLPNDYIMITDNGRGIPVDDILDEHGKSTGQSGAEAIFTVIHSGSKFNKDDDESAYRFSGGLHGVGVSVTNALSEVLVAVIKKNKKLYQIKFADGAVVNKLEEVTDLKTLFIQNDKLTSWIKRKGNGTTVICKPQAHPPRNLPAYFETPKVNFDQLKNYLKVKSALLPNVHITYQYLDEDVIEWKYNSLKDYLIAESDELNIKTQWFTTLNEEEITEETNLTEATKFLHIQKYIENNNTAFKKGEGLECIIGFLKEGKKATEGFVNLIHTPEGGEHERGLKVAIYEGMKSFITRYNLMPNSKLTIEADDIWQKISFVLSVKMVDPKFKGQVKDKLLSKEANKLVSELSKDFFELWLSDNLDFSKKLANMVIENAQIRSKGEIKVERKKGASNATLPGKLTDCVLTDMEKTELFICEGDSAGGQAKQARNKDFQAILPIRGKIQNTWEVESHKIQENNEVDNISIAIGIPPHTLDDKVDFSKLRYGKIFTMCDADVDGRHIEVLLLTLFFRHFPQVIKKGHLFIAQAPLFRVDYPSNKKSKKTLDAKAYIKDELELETFLKKLNKMGFTVEDEQVRVSRFKGLGEMQVEQLWETTMDPANRKALKIVIEEDHLEGDIKAFNNYMSKKEAKFRKDWLEENGNKANVDA